jgi:hypothetical protein
LVRLQNEDHARDCFLGLFYLLGGGTEYDSHSHCHCHYLCC